MKIDMGTVLSLNNLYDNFKIIDMVRLFEEDHLICYNYLGGHWCQRGCHFHSRHILRRR